MIYFGIFRRTVEYVYKPFRYDHDISMIGALLLSKLAEAGYERKLTTHNKIYCIIQTH